MKLNDLDEGIGDSLKTAGRATTGLLGKGLGAVAGSAGKTAGTLGTAFARAVGFDASQGVAAKAQKSMARQQFIGTFVQKMSGFIASTAEAVKDDINLIIKQEQQQQAQQQAAQRGLPTTSAGGIIVPGATSARPKESIDFDLMLKIVLKESQATDQFIEKYANTIENAIKGYMSNQVGTMGPQITNSSKQIAQAIVSEQNYISVLEDLGAAIFDQYYNNERQEFTQTHRAADIPLSSDGQQVLTALQQLDKKEQQIVMDKLKQGGNLF